LVIGSGAREHALVWKLAQSPRADDIYVAPGNAGTAMLAENIDYKADEIDGLMKFARDNRIELTVVGPEGPLAAGIADSFMAGGLAIFGATKRAAEIESSKVFARSLMRQHAIPGAGGEAFSDYDRARAYIRTQEPPIVIKADGLAAGKGVIIAESLAEAEAALEKLMKARSLGEAGSRVLIEEHLHGWEMSYFVFTDGHKLLPMVPACDYKRIYDGNKGPNTGGMGSYSPPPGYSDVLGHVIERTIMEPTVLALADAGRPYKGILYGGLMITNKVPKVIEFNARLGDPEAQVVLPRLKSDLVDIIMAVVGSKLDSIDVTWSDQACVGVVMASGGYPGTYQTGFPVSGLDDVDKDVIVFHAGTRVNPEGVILTCGGRVLTVVATGQDLAEARRKVYDNIPRIKFEGCQYRNDIADLKD